MDRVPEAACARQGPWPKSQERPEYAISAQQQIESESKKSNKTIRKLGTKASLQIFSGRRIPWKAWYHTSEKQGKSKKP
jgi:hypothetical protein